MSQHEKNYEQPYWDESSLKSLQADLAKSGETYKRQESKFERLRIKASQIVQIDQNNQKPKLKPVLITFKKL